jgi:hypothetical protein
VRVFPTVKKIVMKLWKRIPRLQMKMMKMALLCLMATSQITRYSIDNLFPLC